MNAGDVPAWWIQALGRVAVALAACMVIAVVMAFLMLPIVALATYQPVHELISGFGTKVATDAIVVSAKTNGIAFALMLGFGTPFAYLLARGRFVGRDVVITLVELPLVMPPAVAGLGLLVAFGRFGLLGHTLTALGIPGVAAASREITITVPARNKRPKAPNTRLVFAKINSRSHSASFRFAATGKSTGFRCALVRKPTRKGAKTPSPRYAACRASKTFKHLKTGRFVLYVRAIGPGGVDKSPATYKFKIT